MLADAITTTTALQSIPSAGLVAIIIVMAGVVVYLQKRNDKIQEQRLLDAKETGTAIASALEEIGRQSKAMYDILINPPRRGR